MLLPFQLSWEKDLKPKCLLARPTRIREPKNVLSTKCISEIEKKQIRLNYVLSFLSHLSNMSFLSISRYLSCLSILSCLTCLSFLNCQPFTILSYLAYLLVFHLSLVSLVYLAIFFSWLFFLLVLLLLLNFEIIFRKVKNKSWPNFTLKSKVFNRSSLEPSMRRMAKDQGIAKLV